jgi:hypothetical protein
MEIDGDDARNLIRQAEFLESKIEHLFQTWDETLSRMSPPQCKDLVEELRDTAMNHRGNLEKIMRQHRTKNY